MSKFNHKHLEDILTMDHCPTCGHEVEPVTPEAVAVATVAPRFYLTERIIDAARDMLRRSRPKGPLAQSLQEFVDAYVYARDFTPVEAPPMAPALANRNTRRELRDTSNDIINNPAFFPTASRRLARLVRGVVEHYDRVDPVGD